jgi:hypothetical protein
MLWVNSLTLFQKEKNRKSIILFPSYFAYIGPVIIPFQLHFGWALNTYHSSRDFIIQLTCRTFHCRVMYPPRLDSTVAETTSVTTSVCTCFPSKDIPFEASGASCRRASASLPSRYVSVLLHSSRWLRPLLTRLAAARVNTTADRTRKTCCGRP